MIHTTRYKSPVGEMLLAEKDGGLIGLWIEGQKYFLGSVTGEAEEKETPMLLQAMAWLDRYFAGEKPAITELALHPAGSDFRREVWQILCEIPYGTTTTYGEIARQMGSARAQRARRPGLSGVRLGTTPFPSSFPAIGWWGQTAASPAMRAGWTQR